VSNVVSVAVWLVARLTTKKPLPVTARLVLFWVWVMLP
jgi:hypothetical protein